MENRQNILQELKELSVVVANLPKQNTFSVPADYFQQFPALVLARIKAENADFGKKQVPYNIPANYFDGLADNILHKIKQQDQSVEEELNELAPILNTISKAPVYKVPEGYFESLEVTLPVNIAKPSAKVFSLGKTKRILQYAVAACIAAIVVLGAYLYTNHQSSVNDTAMVIPYDSAVEMNINKELSKVDEQEINQYLNESPGVGYAINTSSDEVDIQQSIHAASDEEIKQYLNEGS